jgi:neutral ceramidase
MLAAAAASNNAQRPSRRRWTHDIARTGAGGTSSGAKPMNGKCREIAFVFGLIMSIIAGAAHAKADWKAGVARVPITPKESMWMAGYAARSKPSEGAVHDLWAKALALQDSTGRLVVLVTLDVCGIDREISNRIRDAVKSRHGLERDRIVLACSHTHCGPVTGTNLLTMYKIDDKQRALITAYAQVLETAVIGVVDLAVARLETTKLSWAAGRCDFAVNRRSNKESDVPELRRRLALQGPVDHDLPVLRANRADGSLIAIVCGYACHCTVLDFYRFCGDYAGFAMADLETRHPGAQAMFVAGCGGDQNPIPRRALELAVAYGKQLVDSVDRVLAGSMQSADGSIESSYEEVPLAFASLPAKSQIEQDAKSDNFFIASRARHLLKTIESRGALEASHPYPVQAWRLGELRWIFLGGEVVVDYSLRLKRNLGASRTWVSAYCNDVMAYIPSKRVLKEGGYEGATAMIYYGQPTVWSDDVEETVIAAVARRIDAVDRNRREQPAVHQPSAR